MSELNSIVARCSGLLFAVLLSGCGASDGPPVVRVDDDDPVMVAAVETARNTVDDFVATLENPRPQHSGFSVKVPVSEGDYVEHFWLSGVTYKDGQFSGKLDNEPDSVSNVSLGDEITIAQENISDWMYLEGDRLVGGYTIRALRDMMPAKEREQFDANLPFTLD